jgi:hypothetical protein
MATAVNNFDDGDAVLADFLTAGPQARLTDWAARHPRYARELARAAVDRSMPSLPATDADTDRVAALGRQVLRERRAAAVPLVSLRADAETLGLDDEAIAARVGVPTGLFWKLHRRLIDAATLPVALVDQLAATLERTTEELFGYLRQPPQLATGASYRAEAAPQAVRESFAAALAADPETTPEMRARWTA